MGQILILNTLVTIPGVQVQILGEPVVPLALTISWHDSNDQAIQ